jgi:hypothetical protein
MSQALSSPSSAQLQFSLPSSLLPSSSSPSLEINYFTLIERYKLEERTLLRLEQLRQGTSLSNLTSTTSFPSSSASTSLGSSRASVASSNTTSASASVSASVVVSFREIVEEFALRNNVEFRQRLNPRTGETIQSLENGKSLWEFNGLVCYIDNHVLYVKRRGGAGGGGGTGGNGGGTGTGPGGGAGGTSREKGEGWYPISLEDILTLSKA